MDGKISGWTRRLVGVTRHRAGPDNQRLVPVIGQRSENDFTFG